MFQNKKCDNFYRTPTEMTQIERILGDVLQKILKSALMFCRLIYFLYLRTIVYRNPKSCTDLQNEIN